MPAPLDAQGALAGFPDAGVQPVRSALYDILREEQALAMTAPAGRPEVDRILDLAQAAYGGMIGLLVGRSDAVLDGTRDGDWTLRDVLRHAIAVELRYGAQVQYAAARRDDEPLAAPPERLPCDRLTPPEETFGRTRAAGIGELLDLVGVARRATDQRVVAIAPAALDRPSLWGTRQLTVRLRLHQIAVHLTESVIQMEKCLADAPSLEARRILRQAATIRGSHERWSAPDQRAELDARYRELAAR